MQMYLTVSIVAHGLQSCQEKMIQDPMTYTEIHVNNIGTLFRYPLKPDKYTGDHPIKHPDILGYMAAEPLQNGWLSYMASDEAIDALENDAAYAKLEKRLIAQERKSLREYTVHHAYDHDNSFRQVQLQTGQIYADWMPLLGALTVLAGMLLSLILGGCTPYGY